MYRIIKCIVQGKQACVKNADLRHPSCTTASPALNVLSTVRLVINVQARSWNLADGYLFTTRIKEASQRD